MILQLSAYGLLWIVFPLIVFAAAREGGWRGAVVVHVSIALLIVALDLYWIANHGLQPQQAPLGAAIAISLRALLINVALLPLSIIAIALRHRGSHRVA
jgi:integral membrane sensor domain MASE1